MARVMAVRMPIELSRLDHFPAGLVGIEAERILGILPQPTLMEIEGRRSRPLFLSLLLHGNERSGLGVLKELARRYAQKSPPRSLMIFVGNVAATAEGRRHLPDQPDFNRIWSGGDGPYHSLASRVLARARERMPFASIDIHNNTGDNPHYGCINTLRPADLDLAARFAPIGVFYRVPTTTQSIAFSTICPAITLECGQSGDAAGIDRALSLIDQVLRLDHFPETGPPPESLTLYRTIGAVKVAVGTRFRFGDGDADLIFRHDLEGLNFSHLEAGTPWGRYTGSTRGLSVIDGEGRDLTADMFRFSDNLISLRRPATPAMITTDAKIIRDDCLCYLMEPI